MRKVKKRKKRMPKVSVIYRIFSVVKRIVMIPYASTFILIAFLLSWFYYSGNYELVMKDVNGTIIKANRSAGLVLKDILLEGQEHTTEDEILSAITTNNGQAVFKSGDPILSINLHDTKERLEQLTWVKFASVERQLPSTLNVSIVEKQPAALWQNEGKISLIDDEGGVIDIKNLEEFKNLIIMVGSDVPSNAQSLLKILDSDPYLEKRVSSAIRVGERRWDIRLKNGIEIKLPEENAGDAWAYLSSAQQEARLLDSDIKTIDLRVAQKMFVK